MFTLGLGGFPYLSRGGRVGSVVTRRATCIYLKIRGSSPANGSSQIAG